jgi:hypothetical protein
MPAPKRKAKAKPAAKAVTNWVVVSDLHCGCQLGLCPARGVRLDGGGRYEPSPLQRTMWAWWLDLWTTWLPQVTRGEPWGVIVNGDTTDGRHHGSTTQISQNLSDQAAIAYEVLAPVALKCEGRLYMVRGTEAHVGPSAEEEEALAQRLGAIPDDAGNRARYELWKRIGPRLVHVLHHIGSTSSAGYEATAVHRELVEAYAEAGRWREDPPDAIVRSHRHRYLETRLGGAAGNAIAVVTPGWQLKTPFAYKIAGARQSRPQLGGIVLRVDE